MLTPPPPGDPIAMVQPHTDPFFLRRMNRRLRTAAVEPVRVTAELRRRVVHAGGEGSGGLPSRIQERPGRGREGGTLVLGGPGVMRRLKRDERGGPDFGGCDDRVRIARFGKDID